MATKVILLALAAMLVLPPAVATAADCNGNGTVDDLEPDCNANGLPDDCDIAGKMYWTDSGTDRITRAYLGGTRVESLITTGLLTPRGIAVDPVGGKFYWTDVGTMKIQRADLDGGGVQDLISTGLSSPRGIALDVDAGKLYWTDAGTDSIRRANLDGTGIENLVTTGLQTPFGIALDLAGGKMYFVESVNNAQKIQRANLDGTSVENLVTTGLQTPYYIALDLIAGKMYWTDNAASRIQRANLDGTSVQTVVNNTVAMAPTGIAVDALGGKIYWANNGDDVIMRANLDGTLPEDLVITVQDPHGVALALPIADADQNGIPDECEGAPTLLGAASGKPNPAGPDGFCDLPIDMTPGVPITSEPRSGGITEVIFAFDGPPDGDVSVEADCTCPSPPSYAPVSPPVSCAPDGNTLVCTFSPALSNACTYRLTVASGAGSASVELRGLTSDVTGDGLVNSADRSAIVGVWTGAGFSCGTDVTSSGQTNAGDRSAVVGGWTSPGNCAP